METMVESSDPNKQQVEIFMQDCETDVSMAEKTISNFRSIYYSEGWGSLEEFESLAAEAYPNEVEFLESIGRWPLIER